MQHFPASKFIRILYVWFNVGWLKLQINYCKIFSFKTRHKHSAAIKIAFLGVLRSWRMRWLQLLWNWIKNVKIEATFLHFGKICCSSLFTWKSHSWKITVFKQSSSKTMSITVKDLCVKLLTPLTLLDKPVLNLHRSSLCVVHILNAQDLKS